MKEYEECGELKTMNKNKYQVEVIRLYSMPHDPQMCVRAILTWFQLSIISHNVSLSLSRTHEISPCTETSVL